MKSPIIYYGGKTSMIPHILPLIPEHEVYTETFFGGGAIFWAKPKVPNEATLVKGVAQWQVTSECFAFGRDFENIFINLTNNFI